MVSYARVSQQPENELEAGNFVAFNFLAQILYAKNFVAKFFFAKKISASTILITHYASKEPPGRFLDYCKFLFCFV